MVIRDTMNDVWEQNLNPMFDNITDTLSGLVTLVLNFWNTYILPVIDDINKYLLEIKPRKNSLIRPSIANVDMALIATSVKENKKKHIKTKKLCVISGGTFAVDIIKKFMMLGMMPNINSVIDFATAELVAQEFGVTLEQKIEKNYKRTTAHRFEIREKTDFDKYLINERVRKIFDYAYTSSINDIKEDLKLNIKKLLTTLNEYKSGIDDDEHYSISIGTNNTKDGNLISEVYLSVINELDRLENITTIYKVKDISNLEYICKLICLDKNIVITFINSSYNKNLLKSDSYKFEVEYFSNGDKIGDNIYEIL